MLTFLSSDKTELKRSRAKKICPFQNYFLSLRQTENILKIHQTGEKAGIYAKLGFESVNYFIGLVEATTNVVARWYNFGTLPQNNFCNNEGAGLISYAAEIIRFQGIFQIRTKAIIITTIRFGYEIILRTYPRCRNHFRSIPSYKHMSYQLLTRLYCLDNLMDLEDFQQFHLSFISSTAF